MIDYTKRQTYEIVRSNLTNDRQSWLTHWKEIADVLLPRRLQYLISDTNKGYRVNQKIVDPTGTLALRHLTAWLMSMISSPAKQWSRLTTHDPDMAEFEAVKNWLYIVTNNMHNVFLRTNLYRVLPQVYRDIAGFGTSAILIEEDLDGNVMRFKSFPLGSYMVSTDNQGKVNTFFREFRMTVRQLLQEFGKKNEQGKIDFSNFSSQVKTYYDSKQHDKWIDVCNIIMPNDDWKPNNPLSKKYVSTYYENNAADDDKFLRESGYNYFPVLCPRWEVNGEDVYGSGCPGMDALGEIKELQLLKKRKAQAHEKHVSPPMIASASLRNSVISTLPSGITWVGEREFKDGGLKPAYQVQPDTSGILMDIQDVRQIIKRTFYEDLFLMFAQMGGENMTAREVDERHEEKLYILGSVYEGLNTDLFDPLHEIAFDIMNRQGLIPEPPQELQGVPLKIEYLSIMAQTQKLIGTGGIERFNMFAKSVAEINPQSMDKVDTDQMLDVYSDLTSIPPGIVRSDDKVEEIRQARAEAEAQQRNAEAQMMEAKSMKDLSQVDMEGKNALTQIVKGGGA